MESYLNYGVTLQEAQRRFCTRDLAEIAASAGAALTDSGEVELQFLNRLYYVNQAGEVRTAGEGDVRISFKILLLHYLLHAEGVKVEGKPISFKELPGGAIYIGPFTNRAIRPLINIFGANPGELFECGKLLGAEPAGYGDVSVMVNAFPRVPVTLVLWAGDDEFPPAGNILFDVSAAHYLPTEDYAVLAGMIVMELKHLKPGD
ncbi:MAG TPA: DUF3786 domain-containing protein [Desulfobacteria bacterium]|nr:DUF3786 domain-containing protein [Desulfobacteria bacterium]